MLGRFTRRRAFGTLLAAPLLWAPPSTGVLAGGKAGRSLMLEGDTFVGRTSDPATFVAVVIGEYLTMAYLCDGPGHQYDVWFSGLLTPTDHWTLTAPDGAQLVAARLATTITGQATLRDGQDLTFLATPVTGAAGVYTVCLHDDGSLRGSSSTQAIVEGKPVLSRTDAAFLARLDPVPASPVSGASQEHRADGDWYAARITLADGQTVPVQIWTASADPGHFWLIMLSDGDARGQGTADASGARFDPRVVLAS